MLRVLFLIVWVLTVAVNSYLFGVAVKDVRRSKAWASGVSVKDALEALEMRTACFALLLILLAWGWRALG